MKHSDLLYRSPGFGISLVAESTTGSMLSIQTSSAPPGEGLSIVPEDLGKQAAEMLLEEIYRVSDNQPLADIHLVWLFRTCTYPS